jgi:8-oxo-dGTP pyrophosphatase MutT (NUDIX family)
MVRHRHRDLAWWCLPGGAIEANESPAEAAIRELQEECGVDGVIVGPTSVFMHDCEEHHSFHVDIGNQIPRLGSDPELSESEQILVAMDWLGLDVLAERDRVYLWTAGLPIFSCRTLVTRSQAITSWYVETIQPINP